LPGIFFHQNPQISSSPPRLIFQPFRTQFPLFILLSVDAKPQARQKEQQLVNMLKPFIFLGIYHLDVSNTDVPRPLCPRTHQSATSLHLTSTLLTRRNFLSVYLTIIFPLTYTCCRPDTFPLNTLDQAVDARTTQQKRTLSLHPSI